LETFGVFFRLRRLAAHNFVSTIEPEENRSDQNEIKQPQGKKQGAKKARVSFFSYKSKR